MTIKKNPDPASQIKRIGSLLILLMIGLISACRPDAPAPLPVTATPPPPTETAKPIPTSTPPLSATPTETPIPSATPVPVVRFAVIGDYGEAGPGLAGVAELIDSWEVDLIITTGDNNYPVGSPDTIDENIGQYFQQYIYPYLGAYGPGSDVNRFFPSLGNHDWLWLDAQPYLDYFTLPGNERYYQFNWEFIDFFALSSDWAEPDGIGRNSIQAEWLEGALAASIAEWKVVYFHHAPYTSGYNGPTPHMEWPFKDWGADIVFSGHDHHYERLEIEGLAYIVVGISGGPIYAIPNNYPGSQMRFNRQYGALLVEASPDELWLRFYTIEGELVDETRLTGSKQ